MASQNLGRLINQINGINGVSAGSAAVVNLPVNQRYHRNVYQCVAVNYTGAASANALFSGTISAAQVVIITGGGSTASTTLDVTVVNGQVTAAIPHSGQAGSGFTVGDKITFTDATGTGAVLTVATVSSGALATLTVTSGGTPSPISPVVFFSAVQELVNGINMRDILPADIINTAAANNIYWRLGQLSLYYTEPFFNVNRENEMLSWDMYGQSTFTHKLNIAPSLVAPGLTGVSEFDFLRNVRPTANGGQVPFLQPVSKHSYGFNVVSGINRINTLPFDYPIRRLWIQGSTPGNITGLIVYQDANKVFEVYTTSQMQVMYEDYGFQFGRNNYINATYANTATNSLKGVLNPVTYYDMAYLSDPDQRIFKALSCDNSFVLQVTSAVQQSINVTMEVLPGAYAA